LSDANAKNGGFLFLLYLFINICLFELFNLGVKCQPIIENRDEGDG